MVPGRARLGTVDYRDALFVHGYRMCVVSIDVADGFVSLPRI